MEVARMIARMLRWLITILSLNLIFAAVMHGQVAQATAWTGAEGIITPKQKIYVVTAAHPNRRHTCMVRSIDESEIVCEHLGHTTAYRAEDVTALIGPGKHTP